jgi:hypothetical protein
MESRFAHDFSRVRVHADRQASESAHAVDAIAYVVGRDIAFANGHYAPSTERGRHLLAHELAHVAQQGDGPDSHPGVIRVSQPADGAETAADKAARDVAAGGVAPVLARQPAPLLHRQAAGKGDAPGERAPQTDPRKQADYIDNVVTQVQFEQMQGNYLLDWGEAVGAREEIVRPTEVEWNAAGDELPIFKVHADRASAVAEAERLQSGLSASGGRYLVYSFYRGSNGAILPTRFTPQSASRVYPAIKEVDARFRAKLRQAAEQLRPLAWGLGLGIVGGITLGAIMRRIGMARAPRPGITPETPGPVLQENVRVPRVTEPEVPQARQTTEAAPEVIGTKAPTPKESEVGVRGPREVEPVKIRAKPHPREFEEIRARYPGRGGKAGWKRAEDLEHTWDRHNAGSKGSPESVPDRVPQGARPPGSEHPPSERFPSRFPSDWDLDKIARSAEEVANSPNSVRVTRSDGFIDIDGTTAGLRIRVRVSPSDNRIVTAHPL